jgi:hypothetical protein
MKLSEINAALAADPDWIPDPDPEHPFEIHASHHAIDGACIVCGAPDYWPLITKPCAGSVPSARARSVTASEAARVLRAEWHRFSVWWSEMQFPERLPTAAEWFAEWFEWRKGETSMRDRILREALARCEAGRDAGRDAIAVLREMIR